MEVILKIFNTNWLMAMTFLSLPFATHANSVKSDIYFSAVDVRQLHDQDVKLEKLGNPPRFAVVHNVDIDPFRDNLLVKKENNYIWKYTIHADRAVSINLAFTEFKLSKDAKLKIYSTDFSHVIRDFTELDNNNQNELWTPVVMSSKVTIELEIPKNQIQDVKLKLTKINQGYRTFSQTTEKAGSCNVDVVCEEGRNWQNEINSVAVISTGGFTFCTGFMVNNTQNDKTPYFMTADHCGIQSYNSSSLVVYWNYQASSCRGRRNGRKNQFNTGSTFLSSSSTSDFTLVRLNRSPDKSWGVTYAGWDRSGDDATSATAIHHPATDEKSISFEYEPTTVTSYLESNIPGDSTHVRVEDWDVGTTEPGSSGSPLFDQNHRVIGQLHGGYASCSSQTSDWYGRFFTSWEGDGSSNSRLKDWLDSENTGDLFTDTI